MKSALLSQIRDSRSRSTPRGVILQVSSGGSGAEHIRTVHLVYHSWAWLPQRPPGATREYGPLLGVWDEQNCPVDRQGAWDALGRCNPSGRELCPPDVTYFFADVWVKVKSKYIYLQTFVSFIYIKMIYSECLFFLKYTLTFFSILFLDKKHFLS